MATIGAGIFAAGTWRHHDKVIIPIPKSKLSISASAEKQPRLTAQSLSQNGVVEKKKATEMPSSTTKDETLTLRDYFDQCRELISRSDGGPPRWFSPLECAKDSPLLLYLPGVDGVGLGLMLHHQRLSKIFDIRCMHIPLKDRTSFKELVKFVERAVRKEYFGAPNRPIYLVGESLGGCLALAVAASNPDIDLILILANPATSFGKSLQQTETLLTLSTTFIPEQISSILPYVITLLLGIPVNMVTSAMGKRLPLNQLMKELPQDTIAMSSYLTVFSNAFTVETLRWKVEMLKSAATFVNSQLHAIKAQTLILASGQDQLLPSREEAERLSKVLPNCQVRVFEGKGHALFLDIIYNIQFEFWSGFSSSFGGPYPETYANLIDLIKEGDISLPSILIRGNVYRRGLHHNYVRDYFPPTLSEFQRVYDKPHQCLEATMNPVMLSTLRDGSVVRGLAGIPSEGPVVYVGYHMMLGLDAVPLFSRFWNEKNIVLRALAHPIFFTKLREQGGVLSSSSWDIVNIMGAVPVSPPNFYQLLSSKCHVLLYPGGGREAFHLKGEEYKLFWPELPEFVRMAAKFGAKIVPFGTLGEDDVVDLVLDYDDLKDVRHFIENIPYFKNDIQEIKSQIVNVRKDAVGEVANQHIHIPMVVPKVPGRFYYLFGKPIETQGKKQELIGNREKAHELYLEVKSEVEKCLSYLKMKRENDPFRSIFARLSYQATHGFDSEVPIFDFTSKDS